MFQLRKFLSDRRNIDDGICAERKNSKVLIAEGEKALKLLLLAAA